MIRTEIEMELKEIEHLLLLIEILLGGNDEGLNFV